MATITVLNSKGQPGEIPEENLQLALTKGYSLPPAAGAPNPAVADINYTAQDALAGPTAQNAINAGTGFAVPGAALKTLEKPAAAGLRSAAGSLEKSSLKQRVKSLIGGNAKSVPKEARLEAEAVAPELLQKDQNLSAWRTLKKGEWASTGKRYTALEDKRIELARGEWKAAADSVPRNAEINLTPIIEGLESKMSGNTIMGGEGQALNAGNNAKLKEALSNIRALGTKDRPNVGSFAEVKKYLGILDDEAEAMGGYKAVGADGLTVRNTKDIANTIRDAASKFDTRLAKANDELSMRLKVDKVLRMQEEAERAAGYKGFSPTSHLLAGGVGFAGGGLEGAAAGEAINLGVKGLKMANQSRGVSSARASLTGKMASGARGMADRLNPRYKGMLEAGNPLEYGGQDMGSGIISETPRKISGQIPAQVPSSIGRELGEASAVDTSYVRGIPAEYAKEVPPGYASYRSPIDPVRVPEAPPSMDSYRSPVTPPRQIDVPPDMSGYRAPKEPIKAVEKGPDMGSYKSPTTPPKKSTDEEAWQRLTKAKKYRKD